MNRRGPKSLFAILLISVALGGLISSRAAPQQTASSSSPTAPKDPAAVKRFVNLFCIECHNTEDKTAGLALDAIDCDDLSKNPKIWEKVVRKLVARQMPPDEVVRPSGHTYDSIVTALATTLDRAAAEHPEPGRTDTFRRLNRREYQNAIRDLLAVEIDASALLPNDESSHGFDNVTVGDLSPTLLDRYITAAQKISRLAVGSPGRTPGGDTIRIRPDITQEDHVEGLPIGTRGGALISYTFPQDGEFEIQLRLARDRNEHVEGLHEAACARGSARPRAKGVVHRHGPQIRERASDRRRPSQGPHPRDSRRAQARRDLRAQLVLSARDEAPAVPGPLQHAPAPAHHPGSLPGLDHRAICLARTRRFTQPPPDLRLQAEAARATKWHAPSAFSRRSCAGPTAGRSPTPTSRARCSCTRVPAPRETSSRRSRWP